MNMDRDAAGPRKRKLKSAGHRPARALIGWMPVPVAYRALVSNRADQEPTEQQRQLVFTAHRIVEARAEHLDRPCVMSKLPEELQGYRQLLENNPSAKPFFLEGWTVGLVNLEKICAFQPIVSIDRAAERVRAASEGSVARIAEVTLPLRSTTTLPLTYNELQRTWSLISSDPNLKVLGPCTMPIPEAGGTPVIGFAVSVPTSFMQVVELSGRYFLRDGYHRAYGLLAAGIRQVPAFVRSIESVEQLAPAGMLPQAAYLGPHPPLLVDYFDDQASTTVLIPAVNKQVIIHAVELDIAA